MKSEITKIYLANFLAGLSTVASVIYTLYFLSHGISQAQIGQLFAVFMISMSVFNIPTGAFADIVGHKTSVVIGLFFQGLNGIFFYLYPTHAGMLVGMLSAGLGLALQTGAWSSLTYEILEKKGKERMLAEVSGKAGAYFLTASIIGSLFGGLIYKSFPRLPFLLFFGFIFAAGIVASRIEYHRPKNRPTLKNLYLTTKDGIIYTIKSPKLMGLMILTIAMTTGRMLMNQNISQPYQLSIGVDIALIGVTAAVVQGIQTLVSAWAYKIARKIGDELSLVVTILTPAIAFFMLGKINNLASLGFIFVFYAAQAFKEPISVHLTQKLMLPTHRATMASTLSMLSSVIVGLLLPIGGKVIDQFGINYTLGLLAVWTLLVGGLGVTVYKFANK